MLFKKEGQARAGFLVKKSKDGLAKIDKRILSAYLKYG